MIHIHCIISSTAYTPKVIAKLKAHQHGRVVYMVTKNYRNIEVTVGNSTETWSILQCIKWIKNQEVASFTAHFLSTIASVLINRLRPATTIKWVVWGGDFYDLPQIRSHYRDKDQLGSLSWKERFGYRIINKALIRVDCIIANPCDHGQISKHLDLSSKKIMLNFLLDQTEIIRLEPLAKGGMTLIGNSDDASNRHLTILHQLDYLNSLDRCIIPLSGVTNGYTQSLKNTIAKKYPTIGVDYFDRYIMEVDYFTLLSKCSHLAYGHLRQQGMGTLFSFLISGRVCYLQSENPYYQYLKEEGMMVYPLDELSEPIDSITDKDSERNKELLLTLFDPQLIASQWKEGLNYLKKR